MIQTNTTYIALGSNKGDRFKHLQEAINLIYKRIGKVHVIAKVYNTPALGFSGADFLNTCICVKTDFSVETVLELLQQIEIQMGRVKSKQTGYESRVIDLDILFFNNLRVQTETLTVPHPELANRRFVLQPLVDIAAKETHPVLQQTMAELLATCQDESAVTAINIWLKNPNKKYPISKFNYLAIEGNIGAGKTSLATMIAAEFNAKLILERFADNPFLPKFYEDAKRYAFTLEMSFLADRYQQISDDLSQLDLFKDFIVSDYDIYKSLIFSKITLPEDEFKLYRRLFYLMYKDIAKPELYIYLYQNTQRLQENIKKRGRDYEQNIKDDYLEKINAGYLSFLKSQDTLNVKIIDISNRDFVNNREDYFWVLDEICKA
ncbi:2-amino-4-hydroxy-6-hydroxymethyldihydropteridine diphosphokinase [Bizionia sediminis]|uniref:2-amino-4-hydroxy-6-hydroxymethyldihydropteridine pyrophosphokinase n=1 Tax=Bizionia sediminis TaxID=1737064 RepID=A0ABW5KUF1_9FLAO